MTTSHDTTFAITPEVIADYGLTTEEFTKIKTALGRDPNRTELGIFSVMWSEHCSYKSSRVHLKRLPTSAPWVIQGPGENAGVIDIGDGQAAVFKMESHNHPSYIEPYQGAATGVGGILRDVFTMGARPIANMNALRFGVPSHPKTKQLLKGVVAGIGGYGNCVGVPTVGGETTFDDSFNDNILVNAMTVGIADANRIFYSKAAGVGNSVVYVGSKTGRDGIHGATMASAEFSGDAEDKRPTVQVGDPFIEKLLIEACMELMKKDAIISIQDMGAAGLTSSSVEMASKGGVGIELDLDKVPQREKDMTPYEMMLSESQERMLMVLKPGCESMAEAIFKKWGLDFAVVGKITATRRLQLQFQGKRVADVPIAAVTDAAPSYSRPINRLKPRTPLSHDTLAVPNNLGEALLKLVGGPHLCSRRWIWEQYDHMVMANTIGRPGGDAAVVRVPETKKALAIATDCNPRYCEADAFEGAKQAVVETWRNITAVGAKPLAITDCMNFGSPENPTVMGQFAAAVDGIALACKELGYPVVSGNVSFYNETNGKAIKPVPGIGGVGLLENYDQRADIAFKRSGDAIFLVGKTLGHLGASIFLKDILGREEGTPPPVDLALEIKNGLFIRTLIQKHAVDTVHDLSEGGLAVALVEMCMAGSMGARIDCKSIDLPPHALLFGEDQGRYVVVIPPSHESLILEKAHADNVAITKIGSTGGDVFNVSGMIDLPLPTLRNAYEGWFKNYMTRG